MTLQLKTFRASWGSKREIGNHGNECESIKMYMSRTFFFGPLKHLVTNYSWSIQSRTSYSRPTYSWGFRIGYPAIAGPPKASPAITGYFVVDFRWYHYSRYRYSVAFYPLMNPVRLVRGRLEGLSRIQNLIGNAVPATRTRRRRLVNTVRRHRPKLTII